MQRCLRQTEPRQTLSRWRACHPRLCKCSQSETRVHCRQQRGCQQRGRQQRGCVTLPPTALRGLRLLLLLGQEPLEQTLPQQRPARELAKTLTLVPLAPHEPRHESHQARQGCWALRTCPRPASRRRRRPLRLNLRRARLQNQPRKARRKARRRIACASPESSTLRAQFSAGRVRHSQQRETTLQSRRVLPSLLPSETTPRRTATCLDE